MSCAFSHYYCFSSANSRQIVTPHFVLAGTRGAPAHLTPDLVQQIESLKAFNFSVADIAPIIDAVKAYGESLSPPSTTPSTSAYHRMSCLGSTNSIVLGLRNPILDISHLGLTLPSEVSGTATGNTSAKGLQTITDRGNLQITPASLMTSIRTIQPDIALFTAEEIPVNASRSRTDKAIKRNIQWLGAALLARNKEFGDDITSKPASERPLFFAPLEGGAFIDKRALYNKLYGEMLSGIYSDADTQERAFDGYMVGGIGSVNDSAVRKELISSSLAGMPENKARAINILGQPREVVDAVASGIDLVAVTYPLLMTDAGLAIDAPFSLAQLEAAASVEEKTSESDEASAENSVYPDLVGAYRNMRNDVYREDGRPMVEGCKCYACRKHTRAYIHHLLNAHEMLAEVLLMMHNTHQYGLLFESAREAIAGGDESLNKWVSLAEKVIKTHAIDYSSKKKVKPKDMRDEE